MANAGSAGCIPGILAYVGATLSRLPERRCLTGHLVSSQPTTPSHILNALCLPR